MVCVHLNLNILLSSPWCWWLWWGRWLFNVHAAKLLPSYMVIRFLWGFLQLWYKSSTANIFMNYMFPSNPGGATRLQDQKLHVRLEFRDRTCRPPWLLSARTLPRLAETSSWKWFQFVSLLNFNHVFFADEVNKWFRVKPSPLSVQTTSCLSRNNISCPEGQRTIFTYLPAMLSWQETLSASKTSAATPSNDLCLGLDNCKRAMDIAEREFKIPQVAAQLFCKLLNLKLSWNPPKVLEPEHFASPHLDELSGMTYLSYFMKVASRKILTSNFYMNLRRRTALATTPPWIGWNTRSPTPASTTSGWE